MEAHPTELDDFKVGSLVAGRYEITEHIGYGAMGMVFRVIDRSLDNEVVALKILYPHLVQDQVTFARFRNEVLIARKLTHPNVVRIYDFGKSEQGYFYISMEFVGGTSLDRRIYDPTLKPLTFMDTLKFLREISSGLSYAHKQGIIHRDLKPDNVLISDTGEVKIADFGLAQTVWVEKGLTETGKAVGTPYYMSPEQIQNETLDARCDVYAFGIIGFELLMKRRPFEDESWYKIAAQHVLDPIPDFASRESGIPVWYQEFVQKCGAKRKDDRFQSAEEIAELLDRQIKETEKEALERDKPASSRTGTQSGTLRTTKSFFRKKIMSTAIPVVLISLALLVAGYCFHSGFRAWVISQVGGVAVSLGVDPARISSWAGVETSLDDNGFFESVGKGDLKAMEFLLNYGVDINATLSNGKTAVHVAVENEQDESLRFLLKHGVDPNKADSLGVTPLMRAVETNSLSAIKQLLSANVKVDSQDDKGLSPLVYAVKSGSLALVEAFLEYGANANSVSREEKSVLLYAIDKDNFSITQKLLDHGSDASAPGPAGETPLMAAVKRGNFSIVQSLLLRGVDLYAKDDEGKTALDYAVAKGNSVLAQKLVDAGATVTIPQQAPKPIIVQQTTQQAPSPTTLTAPVPTAPIAAPIETATTPVDAESGKSWTMGANGVITAGPSVPSQAKNTDSSSAPAPISAPQTAAETAPSTKLNMTRLRLNSPVKGVWNRRGRGVKLDAIKAEVRNIGYVKADGIVVRVTIPGGKVVTLAGPASLEPNQMADYILENMGEVIRIQGRLNVDPNCTNCYPH